ncbi:MAG: hypothetical protein PHU01_09355 [Desulfuromonadaceae bacterium]|nr:hypothetical protein [Desulfuromonadaceae bacterium]
MEHKSLITSDGIYFEAVLKDVKKSTQHLQPVFEIFTNALESIKLKQPSTDSGSISIHIFSKQSMNADEYMLHEIVIEDSGVGFDSVNFERMTRYKDNRKGFFNNGSGRVQILHFFDTAKFFSIFNDGSGFKQRSFTLSKHYLFKNAIISDHKVDDTKEISTKTIVTLHGILDKNDDHTYNHLTANGLKKALISRYMMEFCTQVKKLPVIKIVHHLDGTILEQDSISKDDIPLSDEVRELTVHYHRLSIDGKEFEKSDKKELLKLTAFKISAQDLKKNELKLTSKGEIIPDSKIELKNLSQHDQLAGSRYLFMVSGEYIDERDGDTRGSISIQRRDDYKKANASQMNLHSEEYVFLDDIENEANSTITNIYPQIREKKEEKQKDIEKLKKMFLLNEATFKTMSISLDDSEKEILEKVYIADSKIIAKKDAEIKKSIDRLNELDPADSQYQNNLSSITSDLVKAIPLQNRTSLTHYVARRKLVLDLFSKILSRELDIQMTGKRNIDEQLLHNLIFQQSSTNPEESDLWLLNEDFIYFKGTSEGRLCDIEIDGKKVFKSEFSVEEENYLLSLDENRKIKRPDILLFPDEGKCIIIEFKNMDVNISNHLNQINKYAFLIKNYSEEQFHLETFYGYLVGEKLHPLDVRSCDANFIESYHFDYLFRPHERILDVKGIRDGSLYTEVIQYSTLLKRALRRNEIFIQKLTGPKKAKSPAINLNTAETDKSKKA